MLCIFALIAAMVGTSGCSALSSIFGGKKADTTEDPGTDDVDQGTDDIDPGTDDVIDDVEDVPDVKLDVPDVKKDTHDTKDSDSGPDAIDQETDQDIQIDDVDDVTDLSDADDADGVDGASGDAVDASGDVKWDSGIVAVGCKVDDDCGTVAKGGCAPKFVCLVDKATSVGTCVPSAPVTNGTPCNDNDQCTENDVCNGGYCLGTPKNCEDGNPCTVDSCVSSATPAKMCKHANAKSGSPCSDGDSCTVGDNCVAGGCVGGLKNICDCATTADCAVQDSANLCEGKHVCLGQMCVLDKKTVVTCTASNVACQASVCNPTTGLCAVVAANNGVPCSDGNICTFPDLCADGACSAPPVDCDDNNPCTTDSCVSSADVTAGGGCKHVANTLSCEDGDPCTGDGTCTNGSCAKGAYNAAACGCSNDADCEPFGSLCKGKYFCIADKCELDPTTVVKCPTTANTDCQVSLCEEVSGTCQMVFTDGGKPCDDADVCTLGDHCDGTGGCVHTASANCADTDPCTTDLCSPISGCAHTFNTAPCSDGDACTQGDQCLLGKCVGSPNDADGAPYCQCNSNDDCKFLDTNKCQATHACSAAGSCALTGTPPADPCAGISKLPCFTYGCNPSTGKCDSPVKPDGVPCSDGNWCTQNDGCVGGTCTGFVVNCDDGNVCTQDPACDPKLGAQGCSVHPNVDDGKPCQVDDKCQLSPQCTAGVCKGKAPDCNDASPCTVDSCDPKTGCKHAPAADGTVCTDGNPCTGEDVAQPDGSVRVGQDGCLAGKCAPAKAKVCKLTNSGPCYTATCDPTKNEIDPASGKFACVQTPNTAPCQGGDKCIVSMACLDGYCQGGVAKNCDDGNACTSDLCWNLTIDPLTPPGTCKNTAMGGAGCDDGNVCTAKDTCAGNKCVGTDLGIDDGNPCTLDACDSVTGPSHTTDPNGNCGALAKCSTGDSPKCVFATKPLLISELYVGKPNDPSDDWIEVHNPTAVNVPIPYYAIEVAEAKPDVGVGWTTLAQTDGSTILPAHGYLLFAHNATVVGNKPADIATSNLNFKQTTRFDQKGSAILDSDGKKILVNVGQIRLRDAVFGLVHDQLCIDSNGCTDLGKDVTPVTMGNSANSIERKATDVSTATTMSVHHEEWLAGNDYMDGAMPDDNFVIRLAPDPQNKASGVYEPACNGNCPATPLPTVCNFAPGQEECVADSNCFTDCGSGKTCYTALQACAPNQPGFLFSEILPSGSSDPKQQFIEFYNADSGAIDLSGFILEFKTADQPPTDQWIQLYQFPAGVTVPSHRYYTIATMAYAESAGGVDVVLNSQFNFDPYGGALRLWDPRLDLEMDTVAWGSALSCSGCPNPTFLPAPAVAPGNSLERKSAAADITQTLAPGGAHCLAGNSQDSGNDLVDWVEQSSIGPQSLASGEFEPACGGMCPTGLLCPFTGTDGGTCADPQCGGLCNTQSAKSGGGFTCNTSLATPTCDTSGLVIAEVSPQGATSKDEAGYTIQGANNEYIMLYNRSDQDVVLDNLYLNFRYTVGGVLLKATDTDWSKKPLTGVIHAHSYYLVVPSQWDSAIPGPDFVSENLLWGLDPNQGAVRLARFDAAGQNVVLDHLSWGNASNMWVYGEGIGAPPCPDALGPCAIRRLPAAGVSIDDVTSPFSPWYYAGAGHDTNSNKDDFIVTGFRTPHNTCMLANGYCPPQSFGVPQKP